MASSPKQVVETNKKLPSTQGDKATQECLLFFGCLINASDEKHEARQDEDVRGKN
jgi:hypothetical protein